MPSICRQVCYDSSMKARYQYRFYPTDTQQQSLAQLFGCTRVVWNDALALCRNSEKLPTNGDLQKIVLTAAKKTGERLWLAGVSAVPLQQSVADLGIAYKNYFDSLKGKRKGKKVGKPNFKKKQGRQSARFNNNAFTIKGESIYLAKIGDLNPIWSRELPSNPSSVTVIKDAANRYFLSFVVDVRPIQVDAKNQSIGIDLGIRTFAFMSNGEMAKSPDYSRLDKRLRRKQKQLKHQINGSKRKAKKRLEIAKLHNRISDTRKDFLHKLSTKVVSENQTIILEDLNVSGMVKNRKLSRVINLQGWREFRDLVEAKSEKYGRKFVIISRWEPTSQVCSDCGFKWGKLDLKVRTVKCLSCGSTHDRDENAAKNIEKVGIGHCHDSKRTLRDSKTGFPASFVEASRITTASAR
jgi:putative transposase